MMAPLPALRRGHALVLAGLLIALIGQTAAADDADVFRGRPLVDALEELQRRGLRILFSTALVRPGLRVTVEPRATDPRAILEEILEPLDLDAREGPGGSLLIVGRSADPAAGRIKGRVVSATRGAPVTDAVVAVIATSAGARTRPDGTFEIGDVPAGTHDITASAPGFTDATFTGIEVPPDGTARLAISLVPDPGFVEEVVVTPGRHTLVSPDQSSRRVLTGQDVVMAPTIGGDVSRVIELLPGIASADNSAAFRSRGGDTQDVSLVLDGLELYEPFHLRSFQSPFSLIDSKSIERIEFLSGGFTADYGDRHGGFVELATTTPIDARRTVMEGGTLNSRVSYSAPGEHGSLLVTARGWYPQALRDTMESGEDGLDPRFGDAYLKIAFHAMPRTVVSAHALLAYDRLEFQDQDGGPENVDSDNRSGYAWIRALRSWTPHLLTETVLSAGRLDQARRGVADPNDEPLGVKDERIVDFYGLEHDLTWEMSSSHLLRAGMQVRPLRADYRYRLTDDGVSTLTELSPGGTSYGLYLAHRVGLSPRLAAELGMRWDAQTYTGDRQFSPRLNAIWQPGENTEFRLGVGRFSQSQRIHELRVGDGQTQFAPAEVARQASLTFQHGFGSGLRLRLDAYEQRLSRIHPRYESLFNPLELFPETEPDRTLVAPSRARLRGAELLLQGDPAGPFHWWASYTRSAALDVIDGERVFRSWDQPHAGRFLVGYHRAGVWSVALTGSARSGWPTTPVSGRLVTLPSGATEVEQVTGPRNTDRLPPYLRFDLRATRAFQLRGGRMELSLDILNITDRRNACCVDEFFFTPRPNGDVETRRLLDHWLGMTPSISLSMEF